MSRLTVTSQFSFAPVFLALCCSGCSGRNTDPGAPDVLLGNSQTETATDAWLGQWNGPEGTYLRLTGGKGVYEITIRNLDGSSNYQGSTAGALVQFERNGAKESIRATNGAETGMKWLSDKANCLTIRPGEGYCRD